MPRGCNSASRANLRPAWEPGKSANPGGRPRQLADVEQLARQHTAAAIETLSTIMQDRAAPSSTRVSAASVLLDRGWGRARAEVTLTDATNVRSMSDFELDGRLRRELQAFLDTANEAEEAEAEQLN